MKEEKTWLTCKEAAQLLNYSTRHILNLIKKGKFSAEKDINGEYVIQKCDFFRVFPNAIKVEKSPIEEKLEEQNYKLLLEERIRCLEQILDEKSKYNELLTEQLSNFTVEKSKMLDAINSHARLLEYDKKKDRPNSRKLWPFNRS